jgi:hypothetical protein
LSPTEQYPLNKFPPPKQLDLVKTIVPTTIPVQGGKKQNLVASFFCFLEKEHHSIVVSLEPPHRISSNITSNIPFASAD